MEPQPMPAPWPADFPRVPAEEWTRGPIDPLATGYDALDHHAWYRNIDPTVADLARLLEPGDVAVDYSGGTGILARRLLRAVGHRPIGVVNVDASKKFLRLALERLRDEERVAFRRLHYLKDQERLQTLDDVLSPTLVDRGVDAISCTNAIHLYYNLPTTLDAWRRCLRPGGRALIQSGNIRNPDPPQSAWIIDETVHAVDDAARQLAEADGRYKPYRDALHDDDAMARYTKLRNKFFLPVRPLDHYLDNLQDAGFDVLDVETRAYDVPLREWTEFLQVYHEGVLPWVGGSPRVGDDPPTKQAVEDRKALIRQALEKVMGGEDFEAVWTYVTCEAPA